jgi:uncharacterized protein YcnI
LRRTILVAAAALAVAGPARAHVSVHPARVEPGEQTLDFTVPNEYFSEQGISLVDKVVIEVPAGVTVGESEIKPAWTSVRDGRSTSWSGGPIPYGKYETFGLEAEIPKGARELVFEASEYFAFPHGRVERYPVRLSVGARSSSGGHGLAVAALIVALAAAVLAAAAFFLGLGRWLRGA